MKLNRSITSYISIVSFTLLLLNIIYWKASDNIVTIIPLINLNKEEPYTHFFLNYALKIKFYVYFILIMLNCVTNICTCMINKLGYTSKGNPN